jgi:hypothetical protein
MRYFGTHPSTEEWAMGGGTTRLTFWHRPLHAMTDAFTSAGFRIEVIGEPPPAPGAEEQFPEYFAERSDPRFLSFLFFVLRAWAVFDLPSADTDPRAGGPFRTVRGVRHHRRMPLDLYAGIYVRDYDTALGWYTRLLGSGPDFVASETEAVWELAEHRCLFVEESAEHAGHSIHTIFVDDFDARIEQILGRGIEPTRRETYDNGVRKALFHDPDGNEIGFGGAPAAG